MASSAESELSNSATALSNVESQAWSSATPFAKPESKMRNCYCVPGNSRRRSRDALAAAGNAKPLRMPGERHVRSRVKRATTIPDSDCAVAEPRRRAAVPAASRLRPIDRPSRDQGPDIGSGPRHPRHAPVAGVAIESKTRKLETTATDYESSVCSFVTGFSKPESKYATAIALHVPRYAASTGQRR